MKVCVPTINDEGFEATLFDHFGSAPYFTIVDTETREAKTLRNTAMHHGQGMCHSPERLSEHDVEVILCAWMGRRAVAAYNAAGLRAMKVEAGTVNEAVNQLTSGKAELMDARTACGGHRGHTQGAHEHRGVHRRAHRGQSGGRRTAAGNRSRVGAKAANTRAANGGDTTS